VAAYTAEFASVSISAVILLSVRSRKYVGRTEGNDVTPLLITGYNDHGYHFSPRPTQPERIESDCVDACYRLLVSARWEG
jgi:hypothetical protein